MKKRKLTLFPQITLLVQHIIVIKFPSTCLHILHHQSEWVEAEECHVAMGGWTFQKKREETLADSRSGQRHDVTWIRKHVTGDHTRGALRHDAMLTVGVVPDPHHPKSNPPTQYLGHRGSSLVGGPKLF